MGLEIKRSDTPKSIQKFLEKLLLPVLQGCTEQQFNAMIEEFVETSFADMAPWEKGSPKSVKDLSKYEYLHNQNANIGLSAKSKIRTPGHVTAAMNWNRLCDANNDKHSTRIIDGTRIIVCKLKPNPDGITRIALPIDQHRIPKWFKNLDFDVSSMEDTILEEKIRNIFECTGFEIRVGSGGTHDALQQFFGM